MGVLLSVGGKKWTETTAVYKLVGPELTRTGIVVTAIFLAKNATLVQQPMILNKNVVNCSCAQQTNKVWAAVPRSDFMTLAKYRR